MKKKTCARAHKFRPRIHITHSISSIDCLRMAFGSNSARFENAVWLLCAPAVWCGGPFGGLCRVELYCFAIRYNLVWLIFHFIDALRVAWLCSFFFYFIPLFDSRFIEANTRNRKTQRFSKGNKKKRKIVFHVKNEKCLQLQIKERLNSIAYSWSAIKAIHKFLNY